MRIALCNEVLRELEFAHQCALAAALGYDGLEVAPFTLGDEPHRLAPAERRRLRRCADDAGIVIAGLHWLLVKPDGLSITSADPTIRARTGEVIERLVDLCAELGGKVIVHGSPAQRQVAAGDDPRDAWKRARDMLSHAAEAAVRAGVMYCLEALAPRETNFINSLDEAVAMVDAIGNPAFRTMLDTAAAAECETRPIEELIERWVPTGKLVHVQANDANGRAPGQGATRFVPVLRALGRVGYAGFVSVEPFRYDPDGPTVAARAIGYIRGILAALDER